MLQSAPVLIPSRGRFCDDASSDCPLFPVAVELASAPVTVPAEFNRFSLMVFFVCIGITLLGSSSIRRSTLVDDSWLPATNSSSSISSSSNSASLKFSSGSMISLPVDEREWVTGWINVKMLRRFVFVFWVCWIQLNYLITKEKKNNQILVLGSLNKLSWYNKKKLPDIKKSYELFHRTYHSKLGTWCPARAKRQGCVSVSALWADSRCPLASWSQWEYRTSRAIW